MRSTDDRHQGIVYVYCGYLMGARLVVSMDSLRQWWSGPVTVFCSTAKEFAMIDPACRELSVDLILVHPDFCEDYWQMRAALPDMTPYENTLYLDADTRVTGSLDELFGHPLALTQRNDWTSTDGRTTNVYERFQGISDDIDELIHEQKTKTCPTINGGVFSWEHGNPDVEQWRELVMRLVVHRKRGAQIRGRMANNQKRVCDPAWQLLMARMQYKLFDHRFNHLVTKAMPDEDVRVYHYVARHHGRSSKWCEAFDDVMRRNVGGIAEWTRYDNETRKHLERSRCPKV